MNKLNKNNNHNNNSNNMKCFAILWINKNTTKKILKKIKVKKLQIRFKRTGSEPLTESSATACRALLASKSTAYAGTAYRQGKQIALPKREQT